MFASKGERVTRTGHTRRIGLRLAALATSAALAVTLAACSDAAEAPQPAPETRALVEPSAPPRSTDAPEHQIRGSLFPSEPEKLNV